MRRENHAVQEKLSLSGNTGLGNSASSDITISRDEMNLAEFPLTVLSTRSDSTVKTLEFRDTQRLKNGEVIEREWIITAADKFGLPTSTDDDVVLGLIRLTMDQGFRDRKVYFTRYELLQVLRWSTEGRSYSRLTKSLDRLSGVRIRATNAFFDNSLKGYQTCNFGLIDAYEINDERSGKSLARRGFDARHGRSEKADREVGPNSRSFFIWSEALFDSFKSGFIKKLDMELYFSLKSAVSRRLYRYLDKHFYYRSTLEKTLTTFAFEKLGLSRNYRYISQLKQQIEPAAEELVKAGFLAEFEFAGRGEDTVVRFVAKKYQQQSSAQLAVTGYATGSTSIQTQASLAQTSPLHTTVVESLISRGLSLGQANRLLEGKSDETLRQIERIIRYYDTLVEQNDEKVSRNRIGFLYRAVECPERFVVPMAAAKALHGANRNERATNSRMSRDRIASVRPELRIFRADGSTAVREPDQFRRNYEKD